MSEQTKCPVCGSRLKIFSERHLNTKKHQDALKEAGIDPSDDPALVLIGQEEVAEEEQAEKPAPPKLPKPPKATVAPKQIAIIKLDLAPLSVKHKAKEPIPAPKIEPTPVSEYASEEDLELGIPMIPEPPKKKEKLEIETFSPLLEKIKQLESEDIKVVLSNCRRCGVVIAVPIPRDIILNAEIPVVPISYVHKNSENKDLHCITLQLDKDFDIRRQRVSDVILSDDLILKK